MMKLNLIFWAVSLALQCLLLAALFSRGVARRMPIMAILMGFYLVRSMASYAVFRHPQGVSYAFLFSGLAIVDVVLQTVTAWVLFSAAERSAREPQSSGGVGPAGSPKALAGMSMMKRLAVFSVFLIVAAVLAVVGSTLIRANPRAPVDRTILFVSAVYLMVFFATVPKITSTLIRRLVEGFAFYAGASIVCQIGRAVAGAQRNAAAFNWWSYGQTAAYLVVVLFWIVFLPGMTRTENSSVVESGERAGRAVGEV
jgi:hypothetical protein